MSSSLCSAALQTDRQPEQSVEEQEAAELVDRKRNCDVGFDACHNAVRSAQVSRAAMPLQNEGRDAKLTAN